METGQEPVPCSEAARPRSMHLSRRSINIEALLSNLPLFRGLDSEVVARVARATRTIGVRRGHVLFRERETPTGFHLIVYGQVKLTVGSPHGAEKVVDILGQGQTFGEATMFIDGSYPVTAQTLTESLLLHVSRGAILDELDRDPRLVRQIIAGLSLRLHQLLTDVESYSMHSGCQRIVDYLLRDHPTGDEGSITVTLPVGKNVIASRLNLTQETFSRILQNLSAKGLLVVHGRMIHIPHVGRLRTHDH